MQPPMWPCVQVKWVYCWHALAAYWAGVHSSMSKYDPRTLYPQPAPGVLEVDPSMAWSCQVASEHCSCPNLKGLYRLGMEFVMFVPAWVCWCTPQGLQLDMALVELPPLEGASAHTALRLHSCSLWLSQLCERLQRWGRVFWEYPGWPASCLSHQQLHCDRLRLLSGNLDNQMTGMPFVCEPLHHIQVLAPGQGWLIPDPYEGKRHIIPQIYPATVLAK